MPRSRRPSLDTEKTVLAEESIIVEANPAQLDSVHDVLARFWGRTDVLLSSPPEQTWRLQFATAVGEISANIARHAYVIGTTGTMGLRLRLYPDRVEAKFTDHGVAFKAPTGPRGALSPDTAQLPEGGFGLSIVNSTVDDLSYSRTPEGTNSWRLVKRLPVC